ncbi:MAG: carboxymuconolactone decarboxylase family protein [Methylocella sp.]
MLRRHRAPLAQITDKVLFGDVWECPGLSPRDRSLVTITSLISLYRTDELPFHLKRALENGITRDEIIETITHLACIFPAASQHNRVVRLGGRSAQGLWTGASFTF